MLGSKKIGILGGGQLGSMLIRSAIDFGTDIAVMDKDPHSPAARYTREFVCGDPKNHNDVVRFGTGLDILTVEKEDVNVEALKELRIMGVEVFPSPELIELIQDKFTQKQFLQKHGVPVVPGIAVNGKNDLKNLSDKLPGCLKKRRGGYDGAGVMIIRTEKDIERAFDGPCVLEELVNIKYELSVIVSRNVSGNIACYDPVMMVFDNERFVLDYQLCPANIGADLAAKAQDIAKLVAEKLELVGILAVEMFLTNEGDILVNELAPRPHNSGHHTIEACVTSQYEQHLRAILDLPPGDTTTKAPSVMINILENTALNAEEVDLQMRALLASSNTHVHWYGKKERREGRKSGHITITAPAIDQAIKKAEIIRSILK